MAIWRDFLVGVRKSGFKFETPWHQNSVPNVLFEVLELYKIVRLPEYTKYIKDKIYTYWMLKMLGGTLTFLNFLSMIFEN